MLCDNPDEVHSENDNKKPLTFDLWSAHGQQ